MFKSITILIGSWLLLCSAAFAQTGDIKGSIKSSDGVAVEYVNVGLKGTTQGTSSNSKGEFEIRKVTPGTYILVT